MGHNVKKLSSICTLVFALSFVGIGHAEDTDSASLKKPFVPRVDLNNYLQGYSLELNTDVPDQPFKTERQGLITLQDQDELRAYLGLKLTRPIETK